MQENNRTRMGRAVTNVGFGLIILGMALSGIGLYFLARNPLPQKSFQQMLQSRPKPDTQPKHHSEQYIPTE